MHPNPIYRNSPDEAHLDMARTRGFGALCLNGADGMPMIAHVPFVLVDDDQVALIHLMRSNPIARVLNEPKNALLVVNGPDGYISPDWYELDDQVPTWNYVAVHMSGQLSLREHDTLSDLLATQSAEFEGRLAPKPAWTMDKMTSQTRERFMRAIVPCRFEISEIEGTWKLGQNKPEYARQNAARQVRKSDIGYGVDLLSDMMQHPKDLGK